MFGGLVFLTFKSRRQESMYLLFCTPILSSLISNFFDKYDKKTYMKLLRFFSVTKQNLALKVFFANQQIHPFRKIRLFSC